MSSPRLQGFAAALLLVVCSALSAHAQLPERSAFDEHYAPVTLAAVKDVRVSPWVHAAPETLVTPKLEVQEVRSRIEALLKRADIGSLSDAEAKARPDAPVLSLSVVATRMDGQSFSQVMTLDLFQPVMVSASKVRITSATWSTRSISIVGSETPREAILLSIDGIVFEFIKAYRQGHGKPVPKLGQFFDFGPSRNEPTAAEPRPKGLLWSAAQNGLQMTAWPSPVRPVVFAAIRNASERTIHYCDYLVGYGGTADLSARRKGETAWRSIALRPYPNRPMIGGLLCGPNDTLRPGREMPPSHATLWDGAPKAKRKYTFTTYLTNYDFPPDWVGTIECKVAQAIFGGRHEDAFNGTVESQVFEIELPLKESPRD